MILKTSGKQRLYLNYPATSATGSAEIEISPTIVSATSSTITADKERIKNNGEDKATISVNLKDMFGNGIKDRTISLNAERSEDMITPHKASTNSAGKATFNLVSSKEGDATLSARDETDDLAVYNKLTIKVYVPSLLETIKENQTLKKIAKRLNPIAQTAAALGLIPLTIQAIAALPQAFHFLGYLFAMLLESLGLRRRPRPWGTVYDALTGKPIDLAVIRLFDFKTKALVATKVSDLSGRFGFLVNPGTYIASVTKPGYIFPVTKKSSSYLAHGSSFYVGAPITIDKATTNLSLSIPMEPMSSMLKGWDRLRLFTRDLTEWFVISFAKVFIPVLIIGTLFSAFSLWINPIRISWFIFGLYLVLSAFYLYQRYLHLRQIGTAVDSQTNKPIADVSVGVYDAKYQTLRASTTSDTHGRFHMFVPAGSYYLAFSAKGYRFPPAHSIFLKQRPRIYRGGTINLREPGYLGYNVMMEREG